MTIIKDAASLSPEVVLGNLKGTAFLFTAVVGDNDKGYSIPLS